MDTSIKRTRTTKKFLKWSFLLLPTCIKRTLVNRFHHPTCQTPQMRKIASNCHPQIFRFLRSKTWLDELMRLLSQYSLLFSISFCLYRACWTHLMSPNLSCNPCLWYYDQLVHFDKEINANVYRYSLWEYYKRLYCSFEWHLTPHMTLYIETCIRWTPCIKETLQHSPRVFTVFSSVI